MLGINVFNRTQHSQSVSEANQILIGSDKLIDPTRIFVSDQLVQRRHLTIVRDPDRPDSIELFNHGRTVLMTSGLRVFRGVRKKLKLPIEFWIGETFVRIFETQKKCPIDYSINSLPATLYCSTEQNISLPSDMELVSELGSGVSGNTVIAAPVQQSNGPNTAQADVQHSGIQGTAPSAATLSMWFDAFGQLQRSVAGSHTFFSEAARSVFDPGGLDAGMVLLRDGNHWKVAASYVPNPELGTAYRLDLIERVAQEKVTLFHDTDRFKKNSTGGDYSAVVVSPVFDAANHVIGVVYGLRSQHRKNHRRGVRSMEAHFVQLVAEAVSAGLVRLEREAEAARDRVLLDQAFSRKVVEHITNHPASLDGQERDVSVLFTDIRNFSMISERIGTKLTFQMLGDVMERMTDVILEHHGVIIDYYGDGIAAFWNAPVEQKDHAKMACAAGLALLKSLPEINERWAETIGQFIKIGVGIHTGSAQVGNSGTRRKIKYGPRGTTVNVASRIENMTKAMAVPMLVSKKTVAALDDQFITCNMGNHQLSGIKNEYQLYQIFDPHMDVRELEKLRAFEAAIEAYEYGDLAEATEKAIALQEFDEFDPCTEWLMNRVIEKSKSNDSKEGLPNSQLRHDPQEKPPIKNG